jgi:hypothetical protein
MNQPIHLAVNTDDFCVADMPNDMHTSLQVVAEAIEKAVNALLTVGGKPPFVIRWYAIRDKQFNPDGIIGFFRVIAEYPVSEKQNERKTND